MYSCMHTYHAGARRLRQTMFPQWPHSLPCAVRAPGFEQHAQEMHHSAENIIMQVHASQAPVSSGGAL